MVICKQEQHSQQTLARGDSYLTNKIDLGIVRQFPSTRASMKAGSDLILTAILSAFFLWQAWSTLSKYQTARTTLEVRILYGYLGL